MLRKLHALGNRNGLAVQLETRDVKGLRHQGPRAMKQQIARQNVSSGRARVQQQLSVLGVQGAHVYRMVLRVHTPREVPEVVAVRQERRAEVPILFTRRIERGHRRDHTAGRRDALDGRGCTGPEQHHSVSAP